MFSPTLFHAPFRIDAERAGQVYLVGRTPLGTQEILSFAHYPALGPDTACARVGVGGRFLILPPTPGLRNVREGSMIPLLERRSDGPRFLLGIGTRAGQPIGLERNDSLRAGEWVPVLPGSLGDGFERLFEEPVFERNRFYRLQP
jgi:hypothetical protein